MFKKLTNKTCFRPKEYQCVLAVARKKKTDSHLIIVSSVLPGWRRNVCFLQVKVGAATSLSPRHLYRPTAHATLKLLHDSFSNQKDPMDI